jgi:signal transduction histidine kinase/ActR/RegA family two-component response regulator
VNRPQLVHTTNSFQESMEKHTDPEINAGHQSDNALAAELAQHSGLLLHDAQSSTEFGSGNSSAVREQVPDLESYLNRASALELARRSLIGAPVYTVISLIMLLGTPLIANYPWLTVAELLLLAMLGILRFKFALGFEHRYDQTGERAVVLFNVLTALQSLTLSVIAGVVLWRYWASQDVVLTIVLSAGCVAAGTSALSVRKSAHVIFLSCVLLPLGLAVLLVGGITKALLIIGFLMLMAFLVQDGGQARRSYMQQLRRDYDAESSRCWAAAEEFARKKFLAKMTQEIRTPINSIIGITALLLDEDLAQRPRKLAAVLLNNGIALRNQVDSIPGHFKNKPKVKKADHSSFDLRKCVTDVTKMFSENANNQGIQLISRLDDLPKSVIFFKDNYVEQVLINILSNGLQNTDRGSVVLSASCQDLGKGAIKIEFSVIDTGTGQPAGRTDSMFDPVDLFGSKLEKNAGSGLGLAISKGLTELMGGKISMESSEGSGTTVRFTIRVQVDPDDTSWHSPKAILSGEETTLTTNFAQNFPHRILVVDDQTINRKVLCQLLGKMGYQPDEAADGQEAVAAAMRTTYDVIFMDILMPNMSGIEATQWIREHFGNPQLLIIALTSETSKEARHRCLENGMNYFIPKPVQIKKIEAILSNGATGEKKEASPHSEADVSANA